MRFSHLTRRSPVSQRALAASAGGARHNRCNAKQFGEFPRRTSNCGAPLDRRGLGSNPGTAVARAVAGASTEVSSPIGSVTQRKELEYEVDRNGLTRVKYEREGWSFWSWKGLKVHYAEAGQQGRPVVLLVHGYGASAYHWRYQFQALADAGYHVFALDLVGFGLSEKAPLDYSNGRPWVEQISDFLQQVAGGSAAAVIGNSLGAYASLAAAAQQPDLIASVALLNGAGPFRDSSKPRGWVPPASPSALDELRTRLTALVKRVLLYFGFLYAAQPLRIKQVLDLVYLNKDQIDPDLVTSIQVPAMDPAAAEVFFRINNMGGNIVYVDDLLESISLPVLLLWGDADPWIVPAMGKKVKALYPKADLQFIASGHCPHDDSPQLANEALLGWLKGLPSA